MSSFDISIPDSTVSTDDADLTKLSAEELLAVVAELRQENKTLLKAKNKVGLTFKRLPEDGNDSITRLEDGQFPLLTKIDSLSVTKTESTDGNIALIEGENLAVLAALQMTHTEKVDVIYIDPPYNTGNDDFIYEDKRIYRSDASELKNLEETLDGKSRAVGKDDPYRHSKWLSFMERRLFLAKKLLKDTGIIMVAIDDNEHHRLRMLLDEIFGEDNFINNIVWQGGGKNNARFNSGGIDYMFIYARNKEALIDKDIKWREPKSGAEALIKAGKDCIKQANGDTVEGTKLLQQWIRDNKSILPGAIYKFRSVNEEGQVLNINRDLSSPTGKGHQYVVADPVSGRVYKTPKRGWVWTEERMKDAIAAGRIYFPAGPNSSPQGILFLDEFDDALPTPSFTKDRRAAMRNLELILGSREFPFPKDHEVLKRWIGLASPKDGLILDFFAGSGTTGHAIAELNKEDGGSRSAILVTNNEGGIARNVTRERLARVLTGENWADGKEREPLPGNLSFYTLDFKELPPNPLSITQMLEGNFEHLLSLENNTLEAIPTESDEHYVIYRNSNKMVVIWKKLFALYDNIFKNTLDEIKRETPEKEILIYVPSYSKEVLEEIEGHEAVSFPHGHIERYETMISTMRRNQTLPPSK